MISTDRERTLSYTVTMNTFCKDHQIPGLKKDLERVLRLKFPSVTVDGPVESEHVEILPDRVKTVEGDLDGQRRFRPGQVGVVVSKGGGFTYVQFDTHAQPIRFADHEIVPC